MPRGGKRLNSGPKPKYGLTLNKIIRVPESWAEPIKTALATQTNPFEKPTNKPTSARLLRSQKQLSSLVTQYEKRLKTALHRHHAEELLNATHQLLRKLAELSKAL